MTRSILPGRGYANGCIAQGSVLAIAGQIGWDESHRIVPGGFVAQFARAMHNVMHVCVAAGGTAENIISLTIYVVDKGEYVAALKEVGAAYRTAMGHHYPAMALVEVKGLLEPGARVEIQGLAVIP
jgi:enamine deaminase RidA (YjgF/YER057c/UK114 family)